MKTKTAPLGATTIVKAMINSILRPKQIWFVVGGFFSDSLKSFAIGSHIDSQKDKTHVSVTRALLDTFMTLFPHSL